MFSQGDLDKRGVKIMRDGKVAEICGLADERPADGGHHHLEATPCHNREGSDGDPREERCRCRCRCRRGCGKRAGGWRWCGGGIVNAKESAAAPAPAAASTSGSAPKKLPKTASPWRLLDSPASRRSLRGWA